MSKLVQISDITGQNPLWIDPSTVVEIKAMDAVTTPGQGGSTVVLNCPRVSIKCVDGSGATWHHVSALTLAGAQMERDVIAGQINAARS